MVVVCFKIVMGKVPKSKSVLTQSNLEIQELDKNRMIIGVRSKRLLFAVFFWFLVLGKSSF